MIFLYYHELLTCHGPILKMDYPIDIEEHLTAGGDYLLMFVGAWQILGYLVQLYDIHYLVGWSKEICDKDLLNRLVFRVFTKIYDIQKQTIEIVA
jgi:hypothetical protein